MLIHFKDVYFSYPGKQILINCNFQLNPQCRIGLVGGNGTGKTTLLKLIAGELTPGSGTIFRAGHMRIGFHRQQPTFPSEKTIDSILNEPFLHLLKLKQEIDDLAYALSESWDETRAHRYDVLLEKFRIEGGYRLESRKSEMLTSFGFDRSRMNQAVETLSGGEKVRLSLTLLLLQKPDLLVLDEPTNHLDIQSIEWLENDLKKYPGGIIFVSHDRTFLERLPYHIYELNQGILKVFPGPYSTYLKHRITQLKQQQKQYNQQQKDIRKLETFIRKNLAGQKTKQAQSRIKLLESLKNSVASPRREPKPPHMNISASRRSYRIVLEIQNISKSIGNRRLFSVRHLLLQRGDKIGIVGPNGCGKTTFLNILMGLIDPDAGRILWQDHTDIGFYDQRISGLTRNLSIIDEIQTVDPHMSRYDLQRYLARFLFSGDTVLRRIESLSGGELARVALAKLFLKRPNVIIMDEPTNHLDIPARIALEKAIQSFDGSLLIVTHDRTLLDNITNHVWVFEQNDICDYPGNYSYYLSIKQKKTKIDDIQDKTTRSKTDHSRRSIRKQKVEQRKITGKSASYYEREIHNIETELARIKREMIHPSLAADWIALNELSKKKDALESLMEEKLKAWMHAIEIEEQSK